MSIEIELGAYDNVGPPLTIPNREVKCVNADGTANAGEQVGANPEANRGDNM